jgi:hypothetical protein
MITACHRIQNLLYYHLVSKNAKIIIYKTIILYFVLYVCKTGYLFPRKDKLCNVYSSLNIFMAVGTRIIR